MGRLHTCYSPVRRSPSKSIATFHAAPRLACVKPVASVHPEPGSNSSLLFILSFLFLIKNSRQNFFFIYLFCLHNTHEYPYRSWCLRLDFLWIDRESFLTLVLLRLLQLCQCSFALFKCAKVLQRYNLFYSRQNFYQLFWKYFIEAFKRSSYSLQIPDATAIPQKRVQR